MTTDEMTAEARAEVLRRAIDGKRVFLSGPMTGYDDFNEREFVRAQIFLKKLGVEFVYNPIMQWIYEPQRISVRRSHESYMLECIHELSRTESYERPYYHAVVQLDGWEGSEGAIAEDFVAKACGIPRFSFSDISKLAIGEGDGGASEDGGADDGAIPAGLWEEWDGIQLRWDQIDEDGSSRTRHIESFDKLHPVEVSTLVAIQEILSEPGRDITGKDLTQVRVIESATSGMNFFENLIKCDFMTETGESGQFSFSIAGPAIPDSNLSWSEQIWTDHVVWEG